MNVNALPESPAPQRKAVPMIRRRLDDAHSPMSAHDGWAPSEGAIDPATAAVGCKPAPAIAAEPGGAVVIKRGPGRPRKNPLPEPPTAPATLPRPGPAIEPERRWPIGFEIELRPDPAPPLKANARAVGKFAVVCRAMGRLNEAGRWFSVPGSHLLTGQQRRGMVCRLRKHAREKLDGRFLVGEVSPECGLPAGTVVVVREGR